MILQECINTVSHDMEGMNSRRAFISTKYVLAHEQFERKLSDSGKLEIERYKAELENIDSQAAPMYTKLWDIQTLYLVEYEGEQYDTLAETSEVGTGRF